MNKPGHTPTDLTIIDRLRAHALGNPDRVAFRFLSDAALAPQDLSYAQLWRDAHLVARLLAGVAAPGSRIMLFFPPGLDYIRAFYGCMLAGMVAVPLYPPRRNVKSDRIINVAQSCDAVVALTTQSELNVVQAAWDEQNTQGLSLTLYASDLLGGADSGEAFPATSPSDPAFLQYTSGSTGTPKGVIVTHANIVANSNHLTSMAPTGQDDVFVNWVPAFHDLGLVTAVLVPVLIGAPSVLMAPASFVRDPVQWLRAISRYRGTRCGGPNFAYDLCVDKIADADLAGLDLGSWRVAYNAAEPVRADTLARFSQRFAACGFRPQAFYPSYGMAEATLAITGPQVDRLARVLTVDKAALSRMRVQCLDQGDPAGIPMVGCGTAPAPHDVRVVDPDTGAELGDGCVGEIWFAGPSVSPGYWGLAELSQATFGNTIAGRADDGLRYLRTGDMGVKVDGDLFIAGRIKDLIILRGRNYYPQDIEETAARAHPAVRRGHVAAFSVDEGGREQLVVVAELEREYLRSADTAEVIAAIRSDVARAHEVAAARVVLLRTYRIPMTSSGKIQRRQTRAMLEQGSLESVAESAASDGGAGAAPESATEAVLAAIWGRVLDRSRIGIDDNFFEVGGDSLAAVDIMAQMEREFSLDAIDPARMMDYPTIRALAQWVDALAGASVPAMAPNKERPSAYSCPASLAQQRMLFMEELAGASSYYNIPLAFQVDGPLDRAALRAAFGALLAANDVLRTVYAQVDGVPRQMVRESAPFTLEERGAGSDAEVAAMLERDAHYRFDLAAELPIRAALIGLGEQQHVLSINVHHIAADGQGARRMLADLGAAYRHYLAQPDSGPGVLERGVQYADFVEYQSRWLASPQCAGARDYWLAALADAPPLHGIMPDFPRPAVQTVAGAHLQLALPAVLAEAVGATARAGATTPFVIYQAAFAALLRRYSGAADIVFGTAAANRQPGQFANVAGLFANTLVLRFRFDGALGFAALIEQARSVSDGALRHQQFPFDALVEQLRPARSLAYNPLVQIMLVMQDGDGQALTLDGASVRAREQHQSVSKFDLALHIRAGSGGTVLDWEYNTSLFRQTTIERMSAHFVQLLSACAGNDAAAVDNIGLVGAPAAATGDAGDAGAPVCVHRLFEQHAARSPDAVALFDGDTVLTYGQLDEQAERVARHLAQAGAVAGTPVGVCMEKSAALVIAMLAIYKVGGIYVPLDPHYPAQRLAFMLQDAGVGLLLAGTGSELPQGQYAQLDIGRLLVTPADASYPAAAAPEQGAYIIFTSGSTGQPKGVLVTHANLYYSLHANRAAMRIGASDLLPAIGSQAFGVSLLEIMLPLTSGGAVRLLSKAQVVDVEELVRASADVTVLHAVPSLMRQWLDVLESGVQADPYPKLRLLLVGGESVPAGLLRRVQQWRPSVRLLALYGMTESAIVCASYEATGAGAPAPAQYCIGKPYPHARFVVLSEAGQEQPAGVPGELYIGGLSVAAGYVGQPELTAQRFTEHAAGAGERLYRTGDRVRRLDDGNYEFLGRVDHQVSLRGARIELGEIETLANAVDGVTQSVAYVAGDGGALVLYYTSAAAADLQAGIVAGMRAALAQRLPDYMRPSIIEHLSAFPLNPNGKVDRNKLPAPTAVDDAVLPDGDIERRLLAMSHELLERSDFGVTANFFEIGGHSLLAARLATRIRAEFGIAFPLTALFSTPTIRACAAVVEAGLKEQFADDMVRQDGAAREMEDELVL